ncbi:MAG: NPCBM/NEW2 domain-containing protein [Fibrobacterales bacterium]
MHTIINYFRQDHKRFIALLIIFGAFIRLIQLGSHPAGINQDEASIGYDVWALLNYGIDRNNIPWPVHFIAWGSGQNGLYGYFALPFIWLFDLSAFSLRLPSALIGIASFFAAYGVGCRLIDRRFGTLLLLLTVISPWHIMVSRWSLEANIYPSIVLIAFYFLLRASEHKKFLFLFAATLALSLYAYGTSYAFTPLFLIGLALFAYKSKQFALKPVAMSILIFFIIATPIILFVLINTFKLPEIITPYFSIPRYTGNPRFSTITTLFSSSFLSDTFKHLSNLLVLIFGSQEDGFRINSLDYAGIIFPVTIPLALLGGYTACKKWLRDPSNLGWAMLICWTIAGFVTSLMTGPNITRINILIYPLIIFTAYGLYLAYAQWPTFYRIALSMIMIFFSIFILYYFTGYRTETPRKFHLGLGQALIEAKEQCNPDDTIFVLAKNKLAYMHALFFTKDDPNSYHESRSFRRIKVQFQKVRSYNNYTFSFKQSEFETPNIAVVDAYRLNSLDTTHYYVTPFHNYALLLKKSEYAPRIPVLSSEPYLNLYPSSITSQQHITIHTNQKVGEIKTTLFSPYNKRKKTIILSAFQEGVYKLPTDSLYPGYNRLNFFMFDSNASKRIRHTKEVFNQDNGAVTPLSFSSLNGSQDWKSLAENQTVAQKTIKISGRAYSYGMGTHGTSRYTFIPPKNADSLFIAYGLSDEKTCGDGVSISITDGTTTLYQNNTMRRRKLYTTQVAVAQADSLFLISDNNADSHCDHLNWVYPYFTISAKE